MSAHSAQRVASVAADGAAEGAHIRVRLDVFLSGRRRRAHRVAARTLPAVAVDVAVAVAASPRTARYKNHSIQSFVIEILVLIVINITATVIRKIKN